MAAIWPRSEAGGYRPAARCGAGNSGSWPVFRGPQTPDAKLDNRNYLSNSLPGIDSITRVHPGIGLWDVFGVGRGGLNIRAAFKVPGSGFKVDIQKVVAWTGHDNKVGVIHLPTLNVER